MSYNPNWDRWIFASVTKHFDDAAVAASIPMYVEGDSRTTAEKLDYYEFRMNGPIVKGFSKDWWRLDVEINILVVSKDLTDFHKTRRMTGVLAAAFVTGIPLYKYGDGVDDDQSQFGCLILDLRLGDNIVISQLGQLASDLEENQATVEGYYRAFLDA